MLNYLVDCQTFRPTRFSHIYCIYYLLKKFFSAVFFDYDIIVLSARFGLVILTVLSGFISAFRNL